MKHRIRMWWWNSRILQAWECRCLVCLINPHHEGSTWREMLTFTRSED